MTNPPPPLQPPKIPTGQELYDALMGHIEPDLTTEGRKLLKEKYKNETEEQKASRKKRYELAFDRCQQAYDEYMATLDTQVNRYRKSTFDHVEMEDRSREENAMQNLIQAFA